MLTSVDTDLTLPQCEFAISIDDSECDSECDTVRAFLYGGVSNLLPNMGTVDFSRVDVLLQSGITEKVYFQQKKFSQIAVL